MYAQKLLRSLLPALSTAALVCTFVGAPREAAADSDMVFGANDIETAFFISKSNNKNRVDYTLRLDANCAPSKSDALEPYWREFENAPPVKTHTLSMFQYVPYGVSEQKVTKKNADGVEYRVKLRQFDRPIVINTKKTDSGKCSATAYAVINGKTAQFISVFAKLSGLTSVEYIDVFGKSIETGEAVTERIKS